MAPVDRTQITTAEQLFEAEGLGPCELVRGELVMMSPAGFGHGRAAQKIGTALDVFASQRGLGAVVGGDPGFLIRRNPDTVRAPDTAFVRADRIGEEPPMTYFDGAPDLAVEGVSPNDRSSEVQSKVFDWLDSGCVAVWVVDPKTRMVTVYRSRQDIVALGEDETLTAEDLLPGFALAVKDVFGK